MITVANNSYFQVGYDNGKMKQKYICTDIKHKMDKE